MLDLILKKSCCELFFFQKVLKIERKESNTPHTSFLIYDVSKDISRAIPKSSYIWLSRLMKFQLLPSFSSLLK